MIECKHTQQTPQAAPALPKPYQFEDKLKGAVDLLKGVFK